MNAGGRSDRAAVLPIGCATASQCEQLWPVPEKHQTTNEPNHPESMIKFAPAFDKRRTPVVIEHHGCDASNAALKRKENSPAVSQRTRMATGYHECEYQRLGMARRGSVTR